MAKTGTSKMVALTVGNVSRSENKKSLPLPMTAEASVKSSRKRIQKSDCKKELPSAKIAKIKAIPDVAKLKYDQTNFLLIC